MLHVYNNIKALEKSSKRIKKQQFTSLIFKIVSMDSKILKFLVFVIQLNKKSCKMLIIVYKHHL